MAEYIERDEAIRKTLEACVEVVGHGISQVTAVDIVEIMESIPTVNLPDVETIAQKIATALVKADVDCIKICNNFGGGCYWKCEEKIEHIKEWIVGVIENA